MDLAAATRVLGRTGALDRILIEVPPGGSPDRWEGLLRPALPPGVTLARQGARTSENRRMLDAFRWNLRVLSYIALVVGAFLIYNTISVSVVRRRAQIGVVRALGATRGGVLAAFLGEAAAFGVAGALAGIALGRLMAESAVKLVAATVESLYVSQPPRACGAHLGNGAAGRGGGHRRGGGLRAAARLGGGAGAAGGGHGAGAARAPDAAAHLARAGGRRAAGRGRMDGRAAARRQRQADIRISRGGAGHRCSGARHSRHGGGAGRGHGGHGRGACSAWKRCWRRAAWRVRCGGRPCWWARWPLPSP